MCKDNTKKRNASLIMHYLTIRHLACSFFVILLVREFLHAQSPAFE